MDKKYQTLLVSQKRLLTYHKRTNTVHFVKLLLLFFAFLGTPIQVYAACSPLLSFGLANYTFVNNTSATVKLSQVDALCIERTKATLTPGASILQTSLANYIWRFRNASTNALVRETAVTSASLIIPAIVPTLSLSLAGPTQAALNTQYPYTATLINTSTRGATSGTITVKTVLPLGVSFASNTSVSGLFSCTNIGQNGTCTRNIALAPGATDSITIFLIASTVGAKTGSFNVSGGGSVGTLTSNTITTTFVSPSDLSLSIKQPSPVLKKNAMSQIEVRVDNNGSSASVAPTKLSFNLPLNVSAPLKFSRIADTWVCTTGGQVVSCTYNKSLPGGNNTRLRIPIIPNGPPGTIPGPFSATVAKDALETNVSNNGPVSLTPAVAVAALFLPQLTDPLNINTTLFLGQSVLDPMFIPKYALPLPNLFSPFYKHTPVVSAVANKFTLDIKKVKAQILPPGFPATEVYAYGDPSHPDTFSYPGHTIEARSTNTAVNASLQGKTTQVQYQNTLADTFHLLSFNDNTPSNTFFSIVDNTIIGANSSSPDPFNSPFLPPEPQIRSVARLHGGTRNNADSNGFPEAWHSPIPLPNGTNGFNVALALTPSSTTPTVPFNPNPFNYTNNQEASLLWYHDNSLGIARLNVYAGLAGLYVVRDDNEAAMIANNKLPAAQHEVPLVLQDRMFHTDGSLAYPNFNPENTQPVPSSWLPEVYGDVMVVNGVAWPYLQVEPRLYRFRVLNASNSRFYKLSLDKDCTTATITFKVIGTDGGFLTQPVNTSCLVMAPGERYDIIVDFSTFKGKNLTLKNSAGDLFGSANNSKPEVPPVAGLVDQIMQFRVNLPKTSAPLVTLPVTLRATAPTLTATVANPRKLLMWETNNGFGRTIPILGTPSLGKLYWPSKVTETVKTGSVETWEIYNATFYPDPIHIDGATLQVVNRQDFTAILNETIFLHPGTFEPEGELTQFAFVDGTSVPFPIETPLTSEQGWKDTVIVPSSPKRLPLFAIPEGTRIQGRVTRIRVRFDSPAGQYTWHSQRLEHQEHEMIRPLTVAP